MTDDEINRAIAEKLEPLGSLTAPVGTPHDQIPLWKNDESPKRLWRKRFGEIVLRDFHFDPAAAVALAEAFAARGHDHRLSLSPWDDGRWTACATIVEADGMTEFVEHDKFPRAVRDAVARAIGLMKEATE